MVDVSVHVLCSAIAETEEGRLLVEEALIKTLRINQFTVGLHSLVFSRVLILSIRLLSSLSLKHTSNSSIYTLCWTYSTPLISKTKFKRLTHTNWKVTVISLCDKLCYYFKNQFLYFLYTLCQPGLLPILSKLQSFQNCSPHHIVNFAWNFLTTRFRKDL